jgi:hypothetical protein
MLKPIILGAMLFSGVVATPANATEVKLPPMADKGLYCREVLYEAAKQISAAGDRSAARALRYYAQNWTAYVRTAPSRDVNAVKALYVAEAKKDVARKKYRHKDCAAVLN